MAKSDIETLYEQFATFAVGDIADAEGVPDPRHVQRLIKVPPVKNAIKNLMQFYIDDTRYQYCRSNHFPIDFTPIHTSAEDRLNILRSAVTFETAKLGLPLPETLYEAIDKAVKSIVAEPAYEACQQIAKQNGLTAKASSITHAGQLEAPDKTKART